MKTLIALLCLAAVSAPAAAQDKLPGIAGKVDKLQKISGYMPLYWDASAGKMFMEIGRFNQELLYQVSLPAGLGSNPVGLDRGQLGDSSVVVFERVGPKVLMTQPNYSYRASATTSAHASETREDITRFLSRPADTYKKTDPLATPPGEPIGGKGGR